ncbi:DUF983 domain-containing protein [Mucilaginibacter robiniae]|uniref:DUF983 domain-containing protein n=2 Tax=Mucilaginibacter robiniae TaxID=2728022 RepID=A0A7L5E557_9SPHI|nr:DUF983 domain-containing protein [Mucilaginibacter robiniae]
MQPKEATPNPAPYTHSAVKAALHCKCPKCRTGNMFTAGSLGLFNQEMNKNCSHCGFQFEIEPGYFYVAMFISYAMNVAILVTCAVATYILTGSENPWLYLVTILLPSLLLSPFTYRYSRVVLLFWLTPGVHFEPERAKPDYHNPFASE